MIQSLIAQIAAEADREKQIKLLEEMYKGMTGEDPGDGLFMWVTTEPLPEGWEFCDGRNGTPDLRHHALRIPEGEKNVPIRRKRGNP